MKLHEKIYYCRKKYGLSQEALAEKIGVSRQAVSKWETGEAVPEISKLLLLAKTFGVTTDWLLSEEEPREENTREEKATASGTYPAWLDSLPGTLGRVVKKYGWLAGVYLIIAGALFTGMGGLMKYMVNRMIGADIKAASSVLNGFYTIGSDPWVSDSFHGIQQAMAKNNPVSVIGSFVIVLGVIMLICGIVLAVVLKKRGKQQL
ncbi:MAG: helix-turn-helix domain-containing protein [Oscillospiraceae bacterium]